MVETSKQTVLKVLTMFTLLFSLFMCNPTLAFAEGSATAMNDFEVNMNGDTGFNITGSGFTNDKTQAWNDFIKKYKNFIVGIGGMATVTMLGVFIFMFAKLGASAGNEQARRQAINGIMYAGIAAACLGTVTTIVGFFYSALADKKS